MRLVGVVFGLVLGLALYALTGHFVGNPVPGLSPLVTAILPFLLPLTTSEWLLVAVFTVLLWSTFAYVLAVIGTLPGLAVTPLTTPPTPLPASGLENLMRGFFIGLTSALNFGIWALLPMPGPVIGILLGIAGLLAATGLSRTLALQALLGWLSWLMPMSWLVMPLGVLLFVINLPSAVATFGLAAVRFDVLTSTVETTGGIIRVAPGTFGGFNLGNFTFLVPRPPAVGLGVRTPFGTPGLSAHETGHTITVAAFGGVYGWLNAIDENIPPFRRMTSAYGELVPESHLPRGGLTHVRVWS
ncbi:hypothetical protein [Streptomyces prunicolor]|uniref:Integral membrane protein n=1 Tax=Streptomyces prunicolor TaxID=67348 RepID=A0ABU4FSD1_9ACTN|nr:hypothetical protein [Streptomyces prunicolor]MDV7223489.1 hypothetical protein [Streptomyces prunicolor]